MMHRFGMRGPRSPLLGLLAGALLVGGCGPAADPYATVAQVRGPWRSEPLALSPAAQEAAEAACQDSRAALVNGLPLEQLAVIDARGTGRITVIFGGAGAAFTRCELRMTAEGGLEQAGGWTRRSAGDNLLLPPDGLTIESGGGMLGGDGLASNASGRFGGAVNSVRLVFASGTVVQASVGLGWYTAWWPTDEMDFVVEAYDRAGQKIAEVER
jgi:hypothetical protein